MIDRGTTDAPRGREKGGSHAGEGDPRSRGARQGGREVPQYTGRRVRPRGDASHPRRQTRRAFDQAGHCHRAVQSASSGRSTARAEKGTGQGGDQTERETGVGGIPAREEARLAHAIARDEPRARARGAQRGFAFRAGAAGEDGSTAARRGSAFHRGEEGRADEGPAPAIGCRPEGGAHAREAAELIIRATPRRVALSGPAGGNDRHSPAGRRVRFRRPLAMTQSMVSTAQVASLFPGMGDAAGRLVQP